MRHRTVVARASRPVPVYSVTETWRRHRRGCFAVAPAFGVRRLVAAVFRERKPTRCGLARAASQSANKLAHSKRCCDRQTRTFTPYVSCPQCAKHIPDGRGGIVLRRSVYPTALAAARDGSGCSLSRRTGEGQGKGH